MTEIACPECGFLFEPPAPKAKARSHPQLKRFFAVLKAAYHHWPETHHFRPKNAEHLRFWLEVQAGHFEVTRTVNLAQYEGVDAEVLTAILTAFLRTSEDDRMFVELDGALLTGKRALSISYQMLAHLSACKLFTDVDEVIRVELGIEPDELVKQTERAA